MWSVTLAILAHLPLFLAQEECLVTPLVTSPRRTSPHIEDAARPVVSENIVCRSDSKGLADPRTRIQIAVSLRNARCESVANASVFLSQADSSGDERVDCGGKISAGSKERVTFLTVKAGHYRDIKHPERLRPRVYQLEVRPPPGCSYRGMDEDEAYFTQFYFKKDRRRLTDPCPVDQCHSDRHELFLSCRRNSTLRACNVSITVPEIICTPRPAVARSMPPAVTAQPSPAPPARTEVPSPAPPVCSRPPATRWDTPGPFYEDNQPYRNPMCLQDPLYDSAGKLTINFKLSDRSCRSLGSVYVDVWQADTAGEYHDHCRSLVVTNTSGMFTLSTVMPGIYPGRPRHLHYLVHATKMDGLCYREFTTQSYFPGRFDFATLVKTCRANRAPGSVVVEMTCHFSVVLNDPRPC